MRYFKLALFALAFPVLSGCGLPEVGVYYGLVTYGDGAIQNGVAEITPEGELRSDWFCRPLALIEVERTEVVRFAVSPSRTCMDPVVDSGLAIVAGDRLQVRLQGTFRIYAGNPTSSLQFDGTRF